MTVSYSANTEALLLVGKMRTRTLGPERARMCRAFMVVGVGWGPARERRALSRAILELGLNAEVCLAG